MTRSFPLFTCGMSGDRKSTRLNSSHSQISYAVFCLKKKKKPTSLATLTLRDPLTVDSASLSGPEHPATPYDSQHRAYYDARCAAASLSRYQSQHEH